MCGRFSLASNAELLARLFAVPQMPVGFAARYNIAPSQLAVSIYQDPLHGRQAALLRWGLVPHWAKEISIGQRMINARAETLAQRPAFRQAFQQRRCVIPATGFYEWHTYAGRKVPVHFRLDAGQPFGLAGLWEEWLSPQGPLRTFTIVTTKANATVGAVHHRMPAILFSPKETDQWLDHCHFDPTALQGLLAPRPIPGLEGYEVPPLANSPANDHPRCIEPADGGRVWSSGRDK
jgi:putative SOS response-associated peptidase YedK